MESDGDIPGLTNGHKFMIHCLFLLGIAAIWIAIICGAIWFWQYSN